METTNDLLNVNIVQVLTLEQFEQFVRPLTFGCSIQNQMADPSPPFSLHQVFVERPGFGERGV